MILFNTQQLYFSFIHDKISSVKRGNADLHTETVSVARVNAIPHQSLGRRWFFL